MRCFVTHGRFTAGTATCYSESLLTGAGAHQDLARGFLIGTRFHSAPVIRLADAKPMQLGHVIRADGRWRIVAFADPGDPARTASRLRALSRYLCDSPNSPLKTYTPAGVDSDALIEVLAVFQQDHRDLDLAQMPALLLPSKGRYGLVDYEKMYCADARSNRDIFELRGIDRTHGCMVIVRPDQYVAQVLALDAFRDLERYFGAFMSVPRAPADRGRSGDRA